MVELQLQQALSALADYLASTPLNLARRGQRIDLFTMDAVGDFAADTHTVLRPYGGRVLSGGVPELAVQVYTVAKEGTAAAFERASALHSRLRDDLGRPLRELAVGDFVIKAVRNLTMPGKIGVNDQKRPEVVFSFDMSYLPVAG